MAVSRIPDVANAAYDALVADATLIGSTLLNGAKVYAHVPLDTVPPYLVVLGGREAPWAEAFSATADTARECDVDIVAVSKYRGTKQVDDIVARALEVLLTHGTYAGVTGYAGVTFVESQRPAMSETGTGEMWWERAATVRVYVT